jgi:carboxymethylenebutenolidase
MTQGSDGKGFAAAAGEVSAQAIHTGAEGLEEGLATLAGGAPAWYALPDGGRRLPVVLVAEEIFGLHEHIRDVVRRLAKLGYFAVAPDYLSRYGDPATAPDIDALRALVAKVPDAETMTAFDEALAFAEGRDADAARAAVTGFCWGGRIAWLYAAHNPRLAACVPWYGRLDGPRSAAQPLWPIDVVADIRVPTLGLYGGDDPGIPPDLVARMAQRLAGAGAPAEIKVYEGAPHGFFADYRQSYREAAALDGWGRMLAFFRAHGVG